MGRGGRLRLRHRLLAATREFFDLQGFVEVETPLLAPTAIPEEHILPVPCAGGFLQSSPEQYMKRLLASGEKRIYQICKSFRSGERGRLHLPEFTILEWYRAGDDYHQLMNDCVALLRHLAKRLDLPSPFTCRGQPIELNGAWQRLSVASRSHAGAVSRRPGGHGASSRRRPGPRPPASRPLRPAGPRRYRRLSASTDVMNP